ncbi:unnamed protein product [Phytophthora fragariaefolia]|uniref:Unnamed protein product n=1 Tax=Phytophthora fragariaefolia TaxID=1490495 RepID=A0A9W6XDC1_9STRA|nr:unnamed protein product [Phytophthora fragariaefolia]
MIAVPERHRLLRMRNAASNFKKTSSEISLEKRSKALENSTNALEEKMNTLIAILQPWMSSTPEPSRDRSDCSEQVPILPPPNDWKDLCRMYWKADPSRHLFKPVCEWNYLDKNNIGVRPSRLSVAKLIAQEVLAFATRMGVADPKEGSDATLTAYSAYYITHWLKDSAKPNIYVLAIDTLARYIRPIQEISIYMAETHWEQCMLHRNGMMFVGASKTSCYVFALVPHAAPSDLPGGKTYSHDEAILYWDNLEEKIDSSVEPPTKRVRGRPNVSKYTNDIITSERLTSAPVSLPPSLTAGLSSHSMRRGSAAYANASTQLKIQRISTRGA